MGEFPVGWELCQLENCIKILDSLRKPINNKERNDRIHGKTSNELYPYYGATGQVGLIDGYLFDEELVALGEDGAPFFDTLKEKAYMLYGKTWVNNHAHVLKGSNGVNNKYVCYYLNQIDYHGYVNGATRLKLTQANMRKLPFLLAPLNEQIRIANKLDSLLAKVEAAQTRLDKIPTLLKRFRQSVLAAATSGELTAEWREDNKAGNVNEIYTECLKNIIDNKSVKFAKKEFLQNEIKSEIPHEWKWARLSAIAEIASGLAKGSKTKEDVVNLPYLRVANVQRGYLDLENIKIIPVPKSRAKKLYLKKGDILFNEGGDIDKLGRGWIWDGQIEDCVHQNHVFRARVYSDNILPKYISFYGNENARDYFLRGGTQTVNLANLNKTTLSLLPVPLPPIEEQKEIVRRVESLFTLADTVEKQYQQAKQRTDKLTQSLLAKAFRGELVPQDPNDEPAEKLLARIQAEREKLESVKKSRKK